MKTRTILAVTLATPLLTLFGLSTLSEGAEERMKAPLTKAPSMEGLKFRNAATHDQLVSTMQSSRQQDPMKKLEIKPLEVDPSTVNQPKDFVENSTILCLNGMATFVPKQAVLNVPDRMSDRLNLAKEAQIKSFAEFASFNRGWVSTLEVKLEQALGKEPLDEKKLEWVKTSGRVVVATYQGGPVTVLPYIDRSEASAQATSNSSSSSSKP